MYTPSLQQTFENEIIDYIPQVPRKPFFQERESKPCFFFQNNAGLRISKSDYWENYYHDKAFRYEWNNGILEVKDMPTHISIIASTLGTPK